jgi:hypothetical protein
VALENIEPRWILPLFALGWLFVTGLLARLSGWANLAERYAAEKSGRGDRFRFVSGSMGTRVLPVSYSNCLFVTVDAQGVYLSILFPFRFMSPPLYFPWASLEEVTSGRFLLMQAVRIRVKDHWPHITVNGKAGQAVLRAYQESLTAGR